MCALTVTLLIAFASVAAAQPKAAEEKAVDKKVDAKMSTPVVTGKVTEVSAAAKTFTVTTKGKATTFSAADLKVLPKIGDVVDVTYTSGPGGGQMKATTVKSSKSNTSD
ncbi:MAG TPA: hypothetical protein VK548_22120 [Candidatus Acidoferrum sp.]|nr:hypothetical protein [Candidatus Acidoferrum sp.]